MNFKSLRKVDYVVIALSLLVIILSGLVIAGKRNMFSKSPVEAQKKVAFQVFFRGITVTNPNSPFVTGKESFITIRNVPYTKLKIVDVKFDRKKVVVPVSNKNKFEIVDDASCPFQFDFLVTLIDDAKITKDGPVIGGNKIKIGLPIVLEGENYKLNGTVSNVEIFDAAQLKKLQQEAAAKTKKEAKK